MRTAPKFWWKRPRLLSLSLIQMVSLLPASFVYNFIASKRMAQEGLEIDIPVICVGNPVAGGAGKTPTAIKIAELLSAQGLKPVFLLRGYGGTLKGPVQVSDTEHSARHVGDEALMLSKLHPTVIAANRVDGALMAAELAADVIIMDDGFQNPGLQKNLSILVVDAAQGVGNGFVIPAGPLRLSLKNQILRAQAILLIGEGDAAVPVVRQAAKHGVPVFSAKRKNIIPKILLDKRLFAYAGIGNPRKFFDGLLGMGLNVISTFPFPDHHFYSEKDAEHILSYAEERKLSIVTTQKDHVRFYEGTKRAELASKSHVIPLELVIEDEKGFLRMIDKSISLDKKRHNYSMRSDLRNGPEGKQMVSTEYDAASVKA
jgi:tetraacyldisaccharide 4'-kinase